jgi:hypothetical protein
VLRLAAVAAALALAISCTAATSGTPSATQPSEVPRPASPTIAAAPPRFVGTVAPIDDAMRRRLVGRDWHPGCPVRIRDLRVVRVRYWDFDGDVRTGPLIVNERVAHDVAWVFRQLFRARFPINRIALAAAYRPPRPSDWFSTVDVTAAFNCRPATGTTDVLSQHAYGWAIDINPLQNPYVRSDGTVLRRAVKPYLDRSLHREGMIHPGDIVVRAFAHIGWEWGGNWHTLKDYMHFSLTGR